MVAGGILISIAGANPFYAYWVMVSTAFGSIGGIAATLSRAATLSLAGLGIAVAFRARFLNIGGEGQIYMGALGGAFVGLFLGDLPMIAGLPLGLLFSFLTGALWGVLAALICIKFRVHEVIITLMLNYVAIYFAVFLIAGPWRDPNYTEPFTALLTDGVELPIVLPGTRLHAGILVAVVATAIMWFVIQQTVFGYQQAVVGTNRGAAEYAGIKISRVLLISMAISGGLCGLAGFSELAGVQHRMIEELSPGFGYTAIAISLLAQHKPIGVFFVAIAFGALETGVRGMQQAVGGVPLAAAEVLQGLVLLFVIAGIILSVRQRIIEQKKKVSL
jgi:simple sugar transport system permease protein